MLIAACVSWILVTTSADTSINQSSRNSTTVTDIKLLNHHSREEDAVGALLADDLLSLGSILPKRSQTELTEKWSRSFLEKTSDSEARFFTFKGEINEFGR